MHELLNNIRETGHAAPYSHSNGDRGSAKEFVTPVEPSGCELHAILDTLRGLEGTSREAVLATVVQVTGSVYRRPGARMLLLRDGSRVGCIAGPHVEAEIIQHAWWLTEAGTPVVRNYGAASILLERVGSPELSRLSAFLNHHRSAGTPAVVATVVDLGNVQSARVGDRLLLDESWARTGALVGSPMEAQVLTHASAALREKKSRFARLGGAAVFVEWIGPPLSVIVIGGGRDAGPLVQLGRQLGWAVNLTEASVGADALNGLTIDSNTAVVLMTHNYSVDSRLLPRVVERRPFYLGILGPRSRAEKLFAETGVNPGPNICAPAGLDIGGETPEAIAVSIAAEIQAKSCHRSGGPLKRRRGEIHAPTAEKGLAAEEAEQLGSRLSLAH
ncbi:MAG: XdhC family protein [Bryobacterales bacterium]|nr:XdhC family protein [Bryobacterales bacterium]MBV9396747.1 XdhC family protein [Bryobacterales bacterium]